MKSRSDRRQFLKTAALATAGASVLGAPAVAAAPRGRTMPGTAADVVVVGAGFAGMTAAYRLHQMGHSVIVVEALAASAGARGRRPCPTGRSWISGRDGPGRRSSASSGSSTS
jgi:hypothetical protein